MPAISSTQWFFTAIIAVFVLGLLISIAKNKNVSQRVRGGKLTLILMVLFFGMCMFRVITGI